MNALRWRLLVVIAVLAIAQAAAIFFVFEPDQESAPLVFGIHFLLISLVVAAIYLATVPPNPRIRELEEMLRGISIGQHRERLNAAVFGPLTGVAEAANEIASVLGDKEDPAIGAIRTRKRLPEESRPHVKIIPEVSGPRPIRLPDRRRKERKAPVVDLRKMSADDAAEKVMKSFVEAKPAIEPNQDGDSLGATEDTASVGSNKADGIGADRQLPSLMVDDDGTTGNPKPMAKIVRAALAGDEKTDDSPGEKVTAMSPEPTSSKEGAVTEQPSMEPPSGFVQLPTTGPTPEISEEHSPTDVSDLLADRQGATVESAALQSHSDQASQENSKRSSRKGRKKKSKKERRREKRRAQGMDKQGSSSQTSLNLGAAPVDQAAAAPALEEEDVKSPSTPDASKSAADILSTPDNASAKEESSAATVETSHVEQPPEKPESVDLLSTNVMVGDKEQDLEALYISFLDAVGQQQGIPEFDDFSSALSAQRDALMKEHSCKDVRFELSRVGDEVSFQPRLIR